MPEHYRPLLGELAGRTPVPLVGLPDGIEAVTIPTRRNGESRVPRDHRRRVNPTRVDLVADARTPLFEPPNDLSTADLVWVLSRGTRRWRTVVSRFGGQALDAALSLVRSGGVVLRCAAEPHRLKLGDPESWSLSHAWMEQAPDALAELRPTRDPDEVRGELLALLRGIDAPYPLVGERTLLERVPPGSPLAVPAETITTTRSWPTYEAALRAACARARMDRTPDVTELAGLAWGDTHERWSNARSIVFGQLIGMEFSHAVKKSDVDIRVRGPLVWRHGSAIADASRARPWIGLPREGMRLMGDIEFNAEGILLVENAPTFQYVCEIDDVTRSWVCVWGQGKAIVNAVSLIEALPTAKIAAWMDLDAAGLEIFSMLATRLNRKVFPVGMDLALLKSGRARKRKSVEEEEKAMRDNKRLAGSLKQKLSNSGLREVAEYIELTGKSVEQQPLHEAVLPSLASRLHALPGE